MNFQGLHKELFFFWGAWRLLEMLGWYLLTNSGTHQVKNRAFSELRLVLHTQFRNEHHKRHQLGQKYLKCFKNGFGIWGLGVRNWHVFKNGKITHFKSQNTSGGIKLDRIYCSFNTTTNKERIAVLNYAKNNNLVDFKGFSNHKNFVRNLSSYKFAICPEGNGLDTHRFWESLITKTLPIVKKSDFITNFYNIGIPMIVLDDWKELITLDEDTLKKLYNSNYEKLHSQDYITLDFWLERIVKQYLDWALLKQLIFYL